MTIKTYSILAFCAFWFTDCTKTRIPDDRINLAASLPPAFNFSQKGLRVMSTFINKRKGTTSTLYGNALAISAAKAGYPKKAPGLVMSLITWQQKPNPFWIGNNIPGQLLKIEMIETDTKTGAVTYRLFEGKDLKLNPSAQSNESVTYIFNQKLSVLP